MYRKILVALDHSPFRTYLLGKAIEMAKAAKADLMIVHALSAYEDNSPGLPVRAYHTYYPIADSVAWDTYQKRWAAYEQEGLADLQAFAAEATDQGIKAEFTQTAGDPGRIICDVAKSWNADLIMVGNRGRSGLTEFLLGSVSNYVMHHAMSSVLIVQGNTTENQAADQAESATAGATH